jgi:hypothetical protein
MRTVFSDMFGAFVDGWHSDDTVFSRKEKVQPEKERHRLVKRSLLQVINLPPPLPTHH